MKSIWHMKNMLKHWKEIFTKSNRVLTENWEPAKINEVFKGYHDVARKMGQACKISYYVRPWICTRCRGSRKCSRYIRKI